MIARVRPSITARTIMLTNTGRAAIAAAFLLISAAPLASAADWPARPVRIIAPATPGGAADTFGRMLADHLPDILGGKFFVENRAGAGGLIGAQAAANAEPDGYTLATSS